MFGMPGNIGEVRTGDTAGCDRVILHCDLNNFFASVECLYRPDLKDQPVAVGGSVEKRHGIILAKNQKAKAFGVKTAEPIWQAKAKCPLLVILPPDMAKYVKFSGLARTIYERYTDQIEPFGIDECWLDVTGSTLIMGDGPHIADSIRDAIRNELGLTVSVGVSFNKVFAKLGSDMKKPDATTVITRENFRDLVWPLPVDDLLFVGRTTSARLRRIGISTIGRLASLDESFLAREFGKWGHTLWAYANGEDAGEVDKEWDNIQAKGIGNSTTTPHDITSYEDAKAVLAGLAESVAHRMREHGVRGRTVTLGMRTCDLEHSERQRSLAAATCVSGDLLEAAMGLLYDNWTPGRNKPLRSLGIRVSKIENEQTPVQISLFDQPGHAGRKEDVEKAMDKIRERYGEDAVLRAMMLRKPFRG